MLKVSLAIAMRDDIPWRRAVLQRLQSASRVALRGHELLGYLRRKLLQQHRHLTVSIATGGQIMTRESTHLRERQPRGDLQAAQSPSPVASSFRLHSFLPIQERGTKLPCMPIS